MKIRCEICGWEQEVLSTDAAKRHIMCPNGHTELVVITQQDTQSPGSSASAAHSGVDGPACVLRVRTERGAELEIHAADCPIIIGREAEFSDYLLKDPYVSRQQCVVDYDGEFTFESISSYENMFLESASGEIRPVQRCTLHKGEKLLLGKNVTWEVL